MANLPGNANFVSLNTGAPALLFTPLPASTKTINNLQVFNSGSFPAYIGPAGSTPFNSVQVPANGEVILRNIPGPVYGMPSVGKAAGGNATTVSTDTTAGTTAFTVGSLTGFAVGTNIIVGNAAGLESALISGTNAGTTVVTTSVALQYDHVAGATVATATALPTLLRVNPGVV